MNTHIDYEGKSYPFSGYDFVSTEHGRFLDFLSHYAASEHAFFELRLLEKIREGNYKDIADVGANLGNHSLFFKEVMGADVTAFEPIPDTFRHLEKNVPGAVCHNVGLSDASGEMAADAGLMANAKKEITMVNMGAASLKEGTGIKVETLDSFGLSPDLIKIDVEGMELEVLKGATETFERSQPDVWLECEDMSRLHDVRAFMATQGYGMTDSWRGENLMFKFSHL